MTTCLSITGVGLYWRRSDIGIVCGHCGGGPCGGGPCGGGNIDNKLDEDLRSWPFQYDLQHICSNYLTALINTNINNFIYFSESN